MVNLKKEKELQKKGYKIVVGLDEAGRGCERPDAEILTNSGWKNYKDINIVKDKVLSYTENGFMVWQKVNKIIEQNFDGKLLQLKNKGVCIIVTPDHYFTVLRRVFKRNKENGNKLELVGYKVREKEKQVTNLSINDFIPRGGLWVGVGRNNFKIPEITDIIDIKIWVAFLGIYLSEGSVSYDGKGNYRIFISQIKSSSNEKYVKILRLLKKTPFKFYERENGFICQNKQLYEYLKQFGKCYDKFIPKEIKELSPNILNILIDWMILGDGSSYTGRNRKRVFVYYSVSERLKDDFEEILLKAGWTYHTTVRIPRNSYIKGRLIKKENKVPCFEIRLRRNNKVTIKYLHKKEIFYKGKVFCLQLSKYHNFYVRRNGTGYFTGNSLVGPVVASAVYVINSAFKCSRLNVRGSTSNRKCSRFDFEKIKDSKKLSVKQRNEFYNLLTNNPGIKWGIGMVSEKIIDKINILEATKLAMLKAIQNLESKMKEAQPSSFGAGGTMKEAQPLSYKTKTKMSEVRSRTFKAGYSLIDYLILDGNFFINSPIRQESVIGADGKIFSCMAAGIIAKVTRDRLMDKYHKKYSAYGFDKHKGYGTKAHYQAIENNGICPLHRKSFRLLKKN